MNHDRWLPNRADIEEVMAEEEQFEEDALRTGRTTLYALCAARYLPGVTELTLFTGPAVHLRDWTIFPRRRRAHHD
jgi:hypothetical protein